MRNSKLIKLLKCLTEKELYSFSDFVSSPYFNKNQELVRFWAMIKEVYLDAGGHDADDKIFTGLYGEGRHLADMIYGLMALLKDFLAEERYKANSFQRQVNLMNIAYEKNLEPLLNGVEKQVDMLHADSPVRDNNYFFESFIIHAEKDNSFRQQSKISENESLQRKIDALDLFYFSIKLKDCCEMLNRSRIVSTRYEFRILDRLVDYLISKPEDFEEYPAIMIYLNIYMMLTDDEHEKYFFRLRALTPANHALFEKDELRTIYAFGQNYCIRRINQGDTDFYQQLFEIYNDILKAGLVFGDNKNMQWDFKNFVSLGLRLKEYDWTIEMIDSFREALPEAVRKNAYTYNLANYYYETGEYKKATQLLNSVDFTDIYYSLDSKTMLLKIYYKVEEEESFFSLVSSFSLYVRRNRLISRDNAEIYINLITFTRAAFLLKTLMPYRRKKNYAAKLQELKNKILETRKVANINWLLGEVEQLEIGAEKHAA